MQQKFIWSLIFIFGFSLSHLAMARSGQYDEEAREIERQEKQLKKEDARSSNPVTNMASGVKQATVDSASGLISETAEGTREEPPVVGTLEGARRGTEKVVDNTIKGAFKVATLGYGDVESIKKEDPEHGSGEPTKFTIKL